MSKASEEPASPESTAGLSDPRPAHHGPEILGDSAAGLPTFGAEEPSGEESPGQGHLEGTGDETPGLVDPRAEIPDPSGP